MTKITIVLTKKQADTLRALLDTHTRVYGADSETVRICEAVIQKILTARIVSGSADRGAKNG